MRACGSTSGNRAPRRADAAAGRWCLRVLQREGRLRADDAVVVLELVGELQRAARLRLRILGERDGRRAVRDGGELPGHVAGDAPRTVTVPASLMAKRRSSVPAAVASARRRCGSVQPAAGDHVEADLPVARMTSVLPAGTVTAAAPAGTGSPGRRPGRITGGLPV